MAPKTPQLEKMIAKAEELIVKLQEAMMADPPPPPEELAEMEQSIEDQLAKVERLKGLLARAAALRAK